MESQTGYNPQKGPYIPPSEEVRSHMEAETAARIAEAEKARDDVRRELEHELGRTATTGRRPIDLYGVDRYEDIHDIVKVGDNPDHLTFHRPKSNGRLSGTLMSRYELEMIQEHQNLIRGEDEPHFPGGQNITGREEDPYHSFSFDGPTASAGDYERPSVRKARESRVSAERKKADERIKERRKSKSEEQFEHALDKLQELELPGAKPVELLRPATGREKKRARSTLEVRQRLAPGEYIHYDELQTTPRVRTLLHNRRKADSMFGHVAEGLTEGWAIPRAHPPSPDQSTKRWGSHDTSKSMSRVKNTPEIPDFATPIAERKPLKYRHHSPSHATTHNSRIITKDGIVYDRFASIDGKSKKRIGHAVVLEEGVPFSSLSPQDQEIIILHLHRIIEEAEA